MIHQNHQRDAKTVRRAALNNAHKIFDGAFLSRLIRPETSINVSLRHDAKWKSDMPTWPEVSYKARTKDFLKLWVTQTRATGCSAMLASKRA
jgi:hypothetical protein